MKKILRSAFMLLFCMVMVTALASTMTTKAEAATVIDYGDCGDNDFPNGDNVQYTLTSDGVLTIFGKGAMNDWGYMGDWTGLAPWLDYRAAVTEVVIQKGVTHVGDFAFARCVNLTKITFADSVVSIGQGAFCDCAQLANITVPDTVTELGKSLFEGCSSLIGVKLPQGIEEISEEMFTDCVSLRKFEIPDTVKTIGYAAFGRCHSLTDVKIPKSVETIGKQAFHTCSALVSLNIPGSVKKIGPEAFYNCGSLKNIVLPANLTELGFGAFDSCVSLQRINIPAKIDYLNGTTFINCPNLKEVYFRGDAPSIPNDDTFEGVNATCYYSKGNSTWKSSVRQNYGGNLKWVALEPMSAPVATASNVASTGKIKLTWNAVEGAAKYEIYRATSRTGTYSRLTTTANTTVTNTSAEVGKTYYYKVRAITFDGIKSEWSAIVNRTCDLPQPTVTATNVASTGKIKLSWNKIEGAAKYQIVRSLDKTNWEHLAYSTGTSATNTKTDAGKTYYYKIRAVHSTSAATSAYSAVVSRTCDLPQVTGLKATNVTSTGKIKLSWNKVDGAVKYQIVRSLDKTNWEHLAYTTNTSATNTKTDAGKTYYYKVRAVHSDSAATSAYSAVASRTCDLAQPTLTVKLNSNGKPTLSWTKVTGAVKYQIVRSTDNKNWEHLAYSTGTSATNTKAVAGTKYYYKIRAIHSNTDATSAYSAVKYITAK